jgi:stage II sporulation protein D
MGTIRLPIQGTLKAIAGALVLVALAASPAQADYRIAGHGFGHGVGLAQYGAMGYARETSHTYRWILRHYYPGTSRATVASGRMRVRMKQTTAARVSAATLASAADGRRVTLTAQHTYRFVAWGTDGLEVVDGTTGKTRAHLHAPVRVTGSSPLRLLGPAENGVTGGRYRGAIVLLRVGDEVMVVDDVGLESYLYGVVPGEMPATWPVEALRSQAVAARSYAVTSRRPSQVFDVYADTRSQVYRGVTAETARTTDAVRATSGVVLMYGTSVARTLFHSSSGGRTAAVEEIFGGAPVPYLQSVDDPYDRLSPYHDWSVTLTDDEAERRLQPVLAGDLVDVDVVGRTPSGRAATVRVTGTLGTRDVPGATARSLLGLRSSWFSVSR